MLSPSLSKQDAPASSQQKFARAVKQSFKIAAQKKQIYTKAGVFVKAP